MAARLVLAAFASGVVLAGCVRDWDEFQLAGGVPGSGGQGTSTFWDAGSGGTDAGGASGGGGGSGPVGDAGTGGWSTESACQPMCANKFGGAVHVALWACSGSLCKIETCEPGWTDCDNAPASGCEVHTDEDPHDCGGCGWACKTANSAVQICKGATCVHTCAADFGDCNGPLPGNADDACETNFKTSAAHCAGCGKACPLPNPNDCCCSAVCSDGGCSVTNCNCCGGW
ncbi:MAG: hypothetical protein HY744_18225 [Deltaproteobacteria bacterium]|nr:hypothetical protein [Deltaproteobacteria bacterium]